MEASVNVAAGAGSSEQLAPSIHKITGRLALATGSVSGAQGIGARGFQGVIWFGRYQQKGRRYGKPLAFRLAYPA